MSATATLVVNQFHTLSSMNNVTTPTMRPDEHDEQNYSDLSDHSVEKKSGEVQKKDTKESNNVSSVPIVPSTGEFVEEKKSTIGDGGVLEEEDGVAKNASTTDLSDTAVPMVRSAGLRENDDDDLDLEDGDDLPIGDVNFDRVSPQRTISNISVVSIGASSHHLHSNALDDGNSVCGASTDGSFAGFARSAKAESIRARLRQQERKLTDLVQRQATADVSKGDQFKHEMDAVKSNLDKVEQEKYALEQKLIFLKTQQEAQMSSSPSPINVHDVTDHDEFLRDKLNGIQRGFHEQASKIQNLETEIVTKNVEIDKYRHEIVAKLKRVVELEFDLEMHDIHYTEYASNQVKLTDGTFMSAADGDNIDSSEISTNDDMDEVGDDPSMSPIKTSKQSTNKAVIVTENDFTPPVGDLEITVNGQKKKLTPKRAQKLIAKLLKDLDHLEATYKKEKLKAYRTKEQLKNENEELKTKILVLEQEQKKADIKNKRPSGTGSSMNDASGFMNIYQLRKRVEMLEAKRFLYRKEMSRLQDELDEQKKDNEVKNHRFEIEISRLNLALEAANARCVALEQEGKASDVETNHYAAIEQRILENYEMISKLESSSEIKDRQIMSMKKELQKLKLQQIAKGKAMGKYSATDTEVLKADKEMGQRLMEEIDTENDEGEGSGTVRQANVSASFVADLQKQLLMAHEQLVKKDQELVIERAKSACMAANLLDRIAELDKDHERSKRKESSSRRPSASVSAGGGGATPTVNGERSVRESQRSSAVMPSDSSVRSTRSSYNDKFDNASVRSTRSSYQDDYSVGGNDKRRKPRKSLSSRIPFRFNLPGAGKKDDNNNREADVAVEEIDVKVVEIRARPKSRKDGN